MEHIDDKALTESVNKVANTTRNNQGQAQQEPNGTFDMTIEVDKGCPHRYQSNDGKEPLLVF